ncbi:hypothetical protein ACFFRR_010663 [Megaselia abdita]
MDIGKQREYILSLPLDRFIEETNSFDVFKHAIRSRPQDLQDEALAEGVWQTHIRKVVFQKIHSFHDRVLAIRKFKLELKPEVVERLLREQDEEKENISSENTEPPEPSPKKTWNRRARPATEPMPSTSGLQKENKSQPLSSKSKKKAAAVIDTDSSEESAPKKAKGKRDFLYISSDDSSVKSVPENRTGKSNSHTRKTRTQSESGKKSNVPDKNSKAKKSDEKSSQKAVAGCSKDLLPDSKKKAVSAEKKEPPRPKSRQKALSSDEKDSSARKRVSFSKSKQQQNSESDSSSDESQKTNVPLKSAKAKQVVDNISQKAVAGCSKDLLPDSKKRKEPRRPNTLSSDKKDSSARKKNQTPESDSSSDENTSQVRQPSQKPSKTQATMDAFFSVRTQPLPKRNTNFEKSDSDKESPIKITRYNGSEETLHSDSSSADNTSNASQEFVCVEIPVEFVKKPATTTKSSQIVNSSSRSSRSSVPSEVTVIENPASQEFRGEEPVPLSLETLKNKLYAEDKGRVKYAVDIVSNMYRKIIDDAITRIVSKMPYTPVKKTKITEFIDTILIEIGFQDFLVKTTSNDLIKKQWYEKYGVTRILDFDTKRELIKEFYKENFQVRKVWPNELKFKQALYFIYGKTLKFTINHVSPVYLTLTEVKSRTNFMEILEEQLVHVNSILVDTCLELFAKKCLDFCCEKNVWLENMKLTETDFSSLEDISFDESIEVIPALSTTANYFFQPKHLKYEDFLKHTNVRDQFSIEGFPEEKEDEICRMIHRAIVTKNDMLGFYFDYDFLLEVQNYSCEDQSVEVSFEVVQNAHSGLSQIDMSQSSETIVSGKNQSVGLSQIDMSQNSETILSGSHLHCQPLNSQGVIYEDFFALTTTSTQNFFEPSLQQPQEQPPATIHPLVEGEDDSMTETFHFKSPQQSRCKQIDLIERELEQMFNGPNPHEVTILENIVIKTKKHDFSAYDEDVEFVEAPEEPEMALIVVSDEEEAEDLLERLNQSSSEEVLSGELDPVPLIGPNDDKGMEAVPETIEKEPDNLIRKESSSRIEEPSNVNEEASTSCGSDSQRKGVTYNKEDSQRNDVSSKEDDSHRKNVPKDTSNVPGTIEQEPGNSTTSSNHIEEPSNANEGPSTSSRNDDSRRKDIPNNTKPIPGTIKKEPDNSATSSSHIEEPSISSGNESKRKDVSNDVNSISVTKEASSPIEEPSNANEESSTSSGNDSKGEDVPQPLNDEDDLHKPIKSEPLSQNLNHSSYEGVVEVIEVEEQIFEIESQSQDVNLFNEICNINQSQELSSQALTIAPLSSKSSSSVNSTNVDSFSHGRFLCKDLTFRLTVFNFLENISDIASTPTPVEGSKTSNSPDSHDCSLPSQGHISITKTPNIDEEQLQTKDGPPLENYLPSSDNLSTEEDLSKENPSSNIKEIGEQEPSLEVTSIGNVSEENPNQNPTDLEESSSHEKTSNGIEQIENSLVPGKEKSPQKQNSSEIEPTRPLKRRSSELSDQPPSKQPKDQDPHSPLKRHNTNEDSEPPQKRKADGTVAFAKHNFKALELVKKPKPLKTVDQKEKPGKNVRYEIDDTSLVGTESIGNMLSQDNTYFRDSQIMRLEDVLVDEEIQQTDVTTIIAEIEKSQREQSIEQTNEEQISTSSDQVLCNDLLMLRFLTDCTMVINNYKDNLITKECFMKAVVKWFGQHSDSIEIDGEKLEMILKFSKKYEPEEIIHVVQSIVDNKFTDRESNQIAWRKLESTDDCGSESYADFTIFPQLNLAEAFDADVLEEMKLWKQNHQ